MLQWLTAGNFFGRTSFVPAGGDSIMQKYCDIVPDETGWVYVIDGVRSSSCHYTSELALEAAEAFLRGRGRLGQRLYRMQACSGEMLPIEPVYRVPPPLKAHA